MLPPGIAGNGSGKASNGADRGPAGGTGAGSAQIHHK